MGIRTVDQFSIVVEVQPGQQFNLDQIMAQVETVVGQQFGLDQFMIQVEVTTPTAPAITYGPDVWMT